MMYIYIIYTCIFHLQLCIHTYKHACMHAYIYACKYTYIYTHIALKCLMTCKSTVCTRICMCASIDMYTRSRMHVCTQTCKQTYKNTHTWYIYKCIYINAYTHIYMRRCMHTYTQTNVQIHFTRVHVDGKAMTKNLWS